MRENREPRNKTLFGVGVAALAIAAILALLIVTGTMRYATAPFRGAVDQQEITQADGNYRIAAYEEFYNQCASVQADEDRLNNLRDEYEGASDERQGILNTTITAVENSRAEKIRTYNSTARQEATRGAFRASDLPYELDIEGETTCEN